VSLLSSISLEVTGQGKIGKESRPLLACTYQKGVNDAVRVLARDALYSLAD
jgi:hypothetical protein